MKPASSSEGTPKSSQNKTIKKSSKARSKANTTCKSSINPPQTPTTPTSSFNINESPSTSSNTELYKDKSTHKCFAGFGPKSVKYFWEQYDTSDTEIAPDVLPVLAEDVSYKVWECVNNLKTYARHAGGRVTCDLLNEVLKDSDVPPVLGAGDTEWDRVDYDGSFFFHSDSVVELREEYQKQVDCEVSAEPSLTTNWVLDRKWSKYLVDFMSQLRIGIFFGDDECFNYALDTAAFSPYMGCVLKVLLRGCVEMLAFEQTKSVIERTLKFLQAIVFNYYTQHVGCREHLFHLAEILVCQLLGPIEPSADKKEESFELVKNFLENSDAEMKKSSEALNQMDVDDIRSEYEALFRLMERDGFQERDVGENVSFEDIKPSMAELQVAAGSLQEDVEMLTQLKTEPMDSEQEADDTMYTAEVDEDEQYHVAEPIRVEFSPYSAAMVDIGLVEEVCSTIGQLGGRYGYFQSECVFHIQRRLEIHFQGKDALEDKDYVYISRAIRGLMVLGEYAFREFIPYMFKMKPQLAPEWILNDFAPGAQFLQKSDDFFLYEWLEELCGTKLQPFMINHFRYHQRLITIRHKKMRKSTYKIYPKVYAAVFSTDAAINKKKQPSMNDYFPDKADVKPLAGKINFRFSGMRPVAIKAKNKSPSLMYTGSELDKFTRKLVLAKRKLLKPLADCKRVYGLSNFCFVQV